MYRVLLLAALLCSFANAIAPGTPIVNSVTWDAVTTAVTVVYTPNCAPSTGCTFSATAVDTPSRGTYINKATSTSGGLNTLIFASVGRRLEVEIVVVSTAGDGSLQATSSGVFIVTGPPAPVSDPTYTNVVVTSSSISFGLSVASDGGSPLKHFKIQRTGGTVATAAVFMAVPAGATFPMTFTDTGLIMGETYQFILSAENNLNVASGSVLTGSYIPSRVPDAPFVAGGHGLASSLIASIGFAGSDGGRTLDSFDVDLMRSETAGLRVAYVAAMGAISTYTDVGAVSIYADGTKLSLLIEVDSTLACTSNNCGAAAHSGSGCGDALAQGGHLTNVGGADAWTGKMQHVASDVATGKSTYSIEVPVGPAALLGQPFVVYNSAGARVMCGIIATAPTDTRKFVTTLVGIAPATTAGTVTLYTKGSNTLSITIEVDSALACTDNSCGAFVYSGTACTSPGTQGAAPLLNADGVTDAQIGQKMIFVSTNAGTAKSTYQVEITGGNIEVTSKAFVVHNSAGSRVSCGVLKGRQYSASGLYATNAGGVAPYAYEAPLKALPTFTAGGSVSVYTHVNAISVVVEVDATFDCATSNCGAHVHSGSSCATTATQGGHLVNANGEDPWTGKMQFQSTNLATGRSLYTIEVAAGNVAILGKPFIVLNSAGARAMCGMLGRKEYAFEGTLSALTPATETGSVSLYTKGSTLSLVVEADSTLACTAGNCGGHVHSGSGCATTGARGPNMLNADGVTDAWGGKVLTLVSTDTGTAKSTYTVEVPAGNPAVLGKPFVVTNAAGVDVMCGIIAAAPTDTRKFVATLDVIGTATSSGTVEVLARGPETLSITLTMDAALACTANACGGRVHSGTSCTNTATQGGPLLNTDGVTDAQTNKMIFVRTNQATTKSTYTVDVAGGNTAILGKVFVVHDAAGTRVACGKLSSRYFSGRPRLVVATLQPQPSYSVKGAVSVYTTGDDMEIIIEASSTLACTASDCGAHVHSGAGCDDVAAQGGPMLNADGTNAWTGQTMTYVSTDATANMNTYSMKIPAGNPEMLLKPFIVHNAAGARVMCGMLGAASVDVRKFEATLSGISPHTIEGDATVYVEGYDRLSLIITLPSTVKCETGNCGAYVHAGTGCTSTAAQGGVQPNLDGTDPWTGKTMRFVSSNKASKISTYALEITGGNAAIANHPFVIHDSAGTRVSCGMLQPRQFSATPYATTVAKMATTLQSTTNVVKGVDAITNLTFAGLDNGVEYYIRAKAVTVRGKSLVSANFGPVIPTTAPGKPTIVTVAVATGIGGAATIQCQQLGYVGTGYTPSVVQSIVTVLPTDGSAQKILNYEGGCPLTVRGLENGKSYSFSFHLINSVGKSPQSDVTNSVLIVGPPSPPNVTSVTYIDAPEGEFFPKVGIPQTTMTYRAVVNFNPPLNDGGSAVISYSAIIEPEALTAAGGPNAVSFAFSEPPLTEKVSYSVSVRALNEFGASEPSIYTFRRGALDSDAGEGGNTEGDGLLSGLGIETDHTTSVLIIAIVGGVVGLVMFILFVLCAVALICACCHTDGKGKKHDIGHRNSVAHRVLKGTSAKALASQFEMTQASSSSSSSPSDVAPHPQGGAKKAMDQAKAAFDYTAADDTEVSLTEGDVVNVLSKVTVVGEGWWKVCVVESGKEGYAPAAYFEPMLAAFTTIALDDVGPPPPPADLVKSLHPYPGTDDEDLSFEAGIIIEIVSRHCEAGPEWWEGQLWDAATRRAEEGGKRGVFPLAFVEKFELEAVEDAAVVEEEAPPAVAARSSVKKPTLPHRKPSLAPHRRVPTRPTRPVTKKIPTRPKRPKRPKA